MNWTCDTCTEPAVVFDPGSDEIRDLFLLQRGVPMRCWCLSHWKTQLAQIGADGAHE